jgi:hypothetical protein
MNSILFGIACLDEGLPPLDNTLVQVRTMILDLPVDKRRSVSRKIKKICKRAIKEKTENIPMFRRRKIEDDLKQRLAFNRDNTLLINDVLIIRILYVRRYLMEREAKKNTNTRPRQQYA